MAYYSLEPWGPERADLNAGIIASTIANVNRNPKKSAPLTAAQFMPKYGAPEPEPEDEDEDAGMAPEHVLSVMERLLHHQAMVERKAAKARKAH